MMQPTLFDLSQYPVKPKHQVLTIQEYVEIFGEVGPVVNATMAAELVNRARQQIYQLIETGRIKTVTINQRRMIIVSSLTNWKETYARKP